MRKKSLIQLLIAAAFTAALLVSPVAAEDADTQPADADNGEPTVDEIVHRTNLVSYYQGADGRARVRMTITDAQERERSREFTILRWDEPKPDTEDTVESKADQDYTGEQKFYVYFHEPADVNKMVFMVWKHLDRDDDRWLYRPSLDLVTRISASDKRSSFVGSHFLYEDVSGRHTDADTHELVDVTDNYYVLDNTPKDADAVEFSRFRMYIHKKTFIAVQTEYYDKQGEKYRTYQVLKVETIQGNPTVVASRMTDTKLGGHTDMSYSNVEYDVALPEDIFTERYLRNPPMEYIED